MARYLPAIRRRVLVGEGRPVRSGREIVEILEAYDLTGSYRAAAELAGCDHHTVARYVKLRERVTVRRPGSIGQTIDEFLGKIEELVSRSEGRVRADVAHRRIAAMGFVGGERTTRRAVAEVKAGLPREAADASAMEPGPWLQFD